MARCPFADWRPLGTQTQPRMSRHDLLIYHTAGGNSLGGVDSQFRDAGYGGEESHFGVGFDGTIYQWQDTAYTADANLDANDRAISVETADAGGSFSKWSGSSVPAWTDEQTAALIKLGIWVCDTHHIPKVMVPDSGASRRGIAGHRQGIDSSPAGQAGYRKPGTEHWSTKLGKVCPGDRRFAQLKSVVVPGIADPPPPPPKKVPDMKWLAKTKDLTGAAVYFCDGSSIRWVQNTRQLESIQERLRHFGLDDSVAEYGPGELDGGIAGVLVGAQAPDGTH